MNLPIKGTIVISLGMSWTKIVSGHQRHEHFHDEVVIRPIEYHEWFSINYILIKTTFCFNQLQHKLWYRIDYSSSWYLIESNIFTKRSKCKIQIEKRLFHTSKRILASKLYAETDRQDLRVSWFLMNLGIYMHTYLIPLIDMNIVLDSMLQAFLSLHA